jgi:enoyl-[acyl-carrier protein] reductase I
MSGLLQGRRALVTGVANEYSIAWAIAKTLHAHGCALAFTYAGPQTEKHVRSLSATLGAQAIIPCDVSRDDQIDGAVGQLRSVWDRVDVLVHAIAYAPPGSLEGRFADVTTREAFRVALDVSAYSLIGLARAVKPLMRPGASIVSLTYDGSERVVRNYNVMGIAKAALEAATRYLADDLGADGIRVNTISAGPIKTFAAAGIKGMRAMLAGNADRTPLRRNVDQDDVARAALFLCSDLALNVTGSVLHVDAGQNILGALPTR